MPNSPQSVSIPNKKHLKLLAKRTSFLNLACITSSLVPFNLTINPIYVASDDNRADPISRSILSHPDLRLCCNFQLPSELSLFPIECLTQIVRVLIHAQQC